MPKHSFSIAETRTNLPSLVNDVERGTAVEITRRGKPVAVIVSTATYRRLSSAQPKFKDALAEFRRRVDIGRVGLDAGEFEDLRDPSPGREAPW